MIRIEGTFPIYAETAQEIEQKVNEKIAEFLQVPTTWLLDPRHSHVVDADVEVRADLMQAKNALGNIVYDHMGPFEGHVTFRCAPIHPKDLP